MQIPTTKTPICLYLESEFKSEHRSAAYQADWEKLQFLAS